MKIIKIVSLILLVLISATYYPLIASKFDNHQYYTYTEIMTGQEWEIAKVKNKKFEYPINLSMTDEEIKQNDKINNELEKANKAIKDNWPSYSNYNDGNYTGGLTLDALGVNGGSTLSDSEVTSMLHEEAKKQLQNQHDLYTDAINKEDNLNSQMDALNSQMKTEAWDLRNTVNNIKIFSIIVLLLVIFSMKLFKLSKKTFEFIIND